MAKVLYANPVVRADKPADRKALDEVRRKVVKAYGPAGEYNLLPVKKGPM